MKSFILKIAQKVAAFTKYCLHLYTVEEGPPKAPPFIRINTILPIKRPPSYQIKESYRAQIKDYTGKSGYIPSSVCTPGDRART